MNRLARLFGLKSRKQNQSNLDEELLEIEDHSQPAAQPAPEGAPPQMPLQEVGPEIPDVSIKLCADLITTRYYPIYYRALPKNGQVFIKSLFFLLDHGVPFGARNKEEFAKIPVMQASNLEDVMEGEARFMVLREPFDRFLSIYMDEFALSHPGAHCRRGTQYAQMIGIQYAGPNDRDIHLQNCINLIHWLRQNIRHETGEKVNPIWRPQLREIRRYEPLQMTYLTLDGLDWQLPALLCDVVPDLHETISEVEFRNETPKLIDPFELREPSLMDLVYDVYKHDVGHYKKARDFWHGKVLPPFVLRNSRHTKATPLPVAQSPDRQFTGIAAFGAGDIDVCNVAFGMTFGGLHPNPNMLPAYPHEVLSSLDLNGEEDASFPENALKIGLVRDPVERFFCNYFETFYEPGPRNSPILIERLTENGVPRRPGLSADEHIVNCRALIDYLKAMGFPRRDGRTPPHLRSQLLLLRPALDAGFTLVSYEDFGEYLQEVAGIDEASPYLDYLREHNFYRPPMELEALYAPDLVEELQSLYKGDMALYEAAKAA